MRISPVFSPLSNPQRCTSAHALIDCASEADLVSADFVKKAGLHPETLLTPVRLLNADGSLFATLSHRVTALMTINDNHHEQFVAFMLPSLPRYDVILGGPWLERHNPLVDWQVKSFVLGSPYCISECLSDSKPLTVQSSTIPVNQSVSSSYSDSHVPLISATTFFDEASHPDATVYMVYPEAFISSGGLDGDVQLTEPLTLALTKLRDYRRHGDLHQSLSASVFPHSRPWDTPSTLFASASRITEADLDKHLRGPAQHTDEELRRLIPSPFHQWLSCFASDTGEYCLPPHRAEDHAIELQPGATPPFIRGSRPVPIPQRSAVKKSIEDLLAKGVIRPSSSAASSPILLVSKPNGGIRMCVDYRKLNDLTIKRRHPIPLLSETLSNLAGAKWFTKLDVRAAFNQLRIRKGDEWLTSFATRYGQFEWLVMPFGLCNAPATWQSFINSLIRDCLDDFATAYLDDILIYSKTYEEHIQHVQLILQRLQDASLPLDVDKCSFCVQRVDYLGVVLTPEGVEMDPKKVEVITSWKTPQSPRELHRFVGFCNFYRRFIPQFSQITSPLNRLLRCKVTTTKGRRHVVYPPFDWSPECASSFQRLKTLFASASVLAHFDPALPTYVETDASDFITAGVLSQKHDGALKPVAFFSHRMSPAEGNYAIYDKELLAIIRAFELWRPELIGVHEPVKVMSDHQSLRYFMSTKQLTSRQARWAEFLSQFRFIITYRAGKQNTVADALSRPSELALAQAEQLKYRTKTLLHDSNLEPDLKVALGIVLFDNSPTALSASSLFCAPTSLEPPAATSDDQHNSDSEEDVDDVDLLSPVDVDEIRRAADHDTDIALIRSLLESHSRRLPGHLVRRGFRFAMSDFSIEDGTLHVQGRILIPNDHDIKLSILSKYHDSRIFGHPSEKTLFRLISRFYWWQGLQADCERYTASCVTCRRSKPNNFPPPGFLQPLPVGQRVWSDVSIDLAEDLPLCVRKGRAYRHILVIVDRLSKDRLFEPLISKTAEEIAEVLHRRLYCVHGYPTSIISDMGSAFLSQLHRRYADIYKIRLIFASTRHPQTDGQSESTVKALKTYLREFVNYRQNDWADYLPDAEFVSRNWPSHSTGMSPFFAIHGFHPRCSTDPVATSSHLHDPESADAVVARTTAIRRWLKDQLVWQQHGMAAQADRRRRPPSVIRPGDSVFVDESLLRQASDRPSSSLHPVRLGPWRVLRSIRNHAFEIDLPPDILRSGHSPIINAQFLRLARPSIPGQRQSPSPVFRPSAMEGDLVFPEWEVDAVVACRVSARHGLQYKALYKDCDEWNRRPRWQPWTDFEHAPQAVLEFHAANPDAPVPCPFE